MKNIIEVENLAKNFDEIKAVKNISFSVKAGELYSLLGPNGAGKTTTINILSCNMKPDSGDAKIKGFSVTLDAYNVRKFIGICPQENVLYDHLTVYENLIFFGKMYEVKKDILEKRANFLIKKVGLVEKKKSKVDTLSGGQKRRVNLIVGLVHDPDVIFLDEPTAGLDPQTRRLIWDYIEDLKSQNKTIILTTHYMDEADILSDRVGIMDFGEIIAEDTPEKLKESIGKGDNLIFSLNGSDNAIKTAINKLNSIDQIVSVTPLEGVDNSYRITSLDGIGKIGKYTNIFLNEKVKVEDISINANSLENVFLALTGRKIRE